MRRASWLGHYNGSRAEWSEAYRNARINAKNGRECDPSVSGLDWKAGLIVAFDRHPSVDRLNLSVAVRLDVKRMIEEVLK